MTAEIQDYWKKEKKKSLHSIPVWLLSSDMDALHAGSQLRFEQQIINKSYNETGARETGAREGPKNDIRRQIFLLSRITEKESYFGTFYRNLQVSATNMFKIHVHVSGNCQRYFQTELHCGSPCTLSLQWHWNLS